MQDFFEKITLSAENLYIFILNSNLIKGHFMTEQSNNTEQSEYKPKWYDLEGINKDNVDKFLGILSKITSMNIFIMIGSYFQKISEIFSLSAEHINLIRQITLISIIPSIISGIILYFQLVHYKGNNNYSPKYTTITFGLAILPIIFTIETAFIFKLGQISDWLVIGTAIIVSLILALYIHKKLSK